MLGGNWHYHHDTKAVLPSAENYRLLSAGRATGKRRLRAAHKQVVLH